MEHDFAVWLYPGGGVGVVLVIRQLGDIWTVKLYITPGHLVKMHVLFRWFRHPNYFFEYRSGVGRYQSAGRWVYAFVLVFSVYVGVLGVRIYPEGGVERSVSLQISSR